MTVVDFFGILRIKAERIRAKGRKKGARARARIPKMGRPEWG